MKRFSTALKTKPELTKLIPNIQKTENHISFMEALFPRSHHERIVLKEPTLPASISSHRALSSLKLSESISTVYASLELGDISTAEKVFHTIWRTNTTHLKSLQELPKIIHKFIDACLKNQRQQDVLQTSKTNDLALAEEWFHSMEGEFGLKPETHSFALLLIYYMESRRMEKAKKLILLMEEQGISVEKLVNDVSFQSKEDLHLLQTLLTSMGKSIPTQLHIDDLLLGALEDTIKNQQETVEEEVIEELQATDTDGVRILRETLLGKMAEHTDKYHQQMWLESRAAKAAQEQFEAVQRKMPESVRSVNTIPYDLIQTWYTTFTSILEERMLENKEEDQSIMPFLKLFKSDVIARIVVTEVLRIPTSNKDIKEHGCVNALHMSLQISSVLQKEHNLTHLNSKRSQKKLNLSQKIHKIHHAGKLFSMTLRKVVADLARGMEGDEDWKPDWGMSISTQLGSFLLNIAIETCILPVSEQSAEDSTLYIKKNVKVLEHGMMWKDSKQVGIVKFHPSLFDLLVNSMKYVAPWSLPMVVMPLPWVTSTSGGYITHRFSLARTNGNDEHVDYIKAADEMGHLSTILRSLDVLGSTAWRVNKKILKIATHFWNSHIALPCLPSDNIPDPIPEPKDLETNKDVKKKYKREVAKRNQKIANIFSERCSANYKLDIARAFVNERMYFPHNMDFRGRAYPLPPHLNHMGDDLSRGLLLFDDAKKLGDRGLYWLKVQISNLYGFDKASLAERYEFTETHINEVLDSAKNPIEGNRWWLKGDKPWQLLAACMELEEALCMEDPREYESRIPVHQDGSCNGLQHYAALGGDVVGAAAVNLRPSDRPGDVYSQVARGVQVRVDKDAEQGIEEAITMKTRINRKLVKQTVMTNTYGVTRIGARDQIKSRLKEARVFEDPKTALTDEQISKCSGYITTKVFESMGDMFTGARAIQVWLNNAARLVTSSVPAARIPHNDKELYQAMVDVGLLEQVKRPSKIEETPEPKEQEEIQDEVDAILQAIEADVTDQGVLDTDALLDEDLDEKEFVQIQKGPMKITSMTWTSPLGFPIVQPYRKSHASQVKTYLQTFTIRESSSASPVNPMKQSSAFPPNFVHSLDASHMMLTCLSCHQNGLTFAAVHDSYWTHATDIDTMSELLRDAFIRLHSKNIMERLQEELYSRFGNHRLLVPVQIKTVKEKELWETVCRKLGRKHRKIGKVDVWVPFMLPPLPEKGEFQVQEVKHSQYFFH